MRINASRGYGGQPWTVTHTRLPHQKALKPRT